MTKAKTPRTWVELGAGVRPSVPIVENDASLREAVREASHSHDLIEALRQVLVTRGYDVVPAGSAEEGRGMISQQPFRRIYSDGTPIIDRRSARQEASAGPRVEDREDGTARIQIDQVVPWPVAMQLLDILADSPSEGPQRRS